MTGKGRRRTGDAEQRDPAIASNPIVDLVKGNDKRPADLGGLSYEDQAALLEAASDGLKSRSTAVKRASAWVLGSLDVLYEDTPGTLAKLLRDRSPGVRMAAAWALGDMGEEAAPVIPDLVAALSDRSDGVRFAAVSALGALWPVAKPAVPVLLTLVESSASMQTRAMAIKALGDIAPDDPGVKAAVQRTLTDGTNDERFMAAYVAGQAANVEESARQSLSEGLATDCPYLVQITAWALGRIGDKGGDAVPTLLAALRRAHWLQIEHSEEQGAEFISIRPVFRDALGATLPTSSDAAYEDFRLKFFMGVFRPDVASDDRWVAEIADHPWYLKLQRRRFGHPQSSAQRQAVEEMLQEARAKFVQRLRRNPTLGVTPERYKELPGYIKRHCRNIAWRLRLQANKGPAARRSPIPIGELAGAADDDGSDVARALLDFVEQKLPVDERDVLRLRWWFGQSNRQTAAALGLTPSKVKTREKRALRKIKDHFSLPP